ncbi:DNA damage-inducible protein DinB [Geothrix limicola]|uniref:DNA damage-inducible protein DinB n=1 Tax=Geothrix limicola TaxID=2927978 RepID=A0ABQ5QJF6_9BACT|nr:DinB family protein [Geothrix limicola]GLH74701.1 DNA damage-inducible protein DinB [Geothrix limicola]
MLGPLKDLLGHQAWADAMFFRAWGKSGALEDEDLRRRTDHLVSTQEAFLQVLKGGAVSMSEGPLPDFNALKARCEAVHQVFKALGHSLDPASLARTVRIPWFPEPPCVIPVSDALLQVCLHTQHHRGQNMMRIKALGGAPKNVDYIIWLWKGKPEAIWP